MSHALYIPEELYAKLAEYAAKRHQEPDTVATELLTEAVTSQGTETVENSPQIVEALDALNRLAGSISVNDPGLADEHDKYFGCGDDDAKDQ